MTIGEIISIEDKLATVRLSYGELVRFNVTHRSVTHGHLFGVGDRVSLRVSTDGRRIVSVVPA